MDLKLFGERIRTLRQSFNYSQNEVYKLSGVSAETQRILEGGIRPVSTVTINRLSYTYKTDLFLLLSNCRSEYDLLNQSGIARVYDALNSKDLEAMHYVIDIVLKKINTDLKEQFDDHALILSKYLKAFNDHKQHDIKYKKINSIILEELLIQLSQVDQSILADPAHLDLEIAISLYLATTYRKEGELQRSKALLMECYEYLTGLDFLTPIQSRHLGGTIAGIAYLFHREEKYIECISFIEGELTNPSRLFTQTARNELLMRLGISYHLSGDERKAYDIFTGVLVCESGNRRNVYHDVLKNQYGIEHHICR